MNNVWLLERKHYELLQGLLDAYLKSNPSGVFTKDDLVRSTALRRKTDSDKREQAKEANARGRIHIEGTLTEKPISLMDITGQSYTLYGDIQKQIVNLNKDSNIKEIELLIDSAGGEFVGLMETAKIVAQSQKPVIAIGRSLAASAAYILASGAKKIYAYNESSTFGSLGVVATFKVNQEEVNINNSDSPAKNPDVQTPEGQIIIKEHLDEIFDLTLNHVAKYRGQSKEYIVQQYGEGRIFLAQKATELTMIDGFVPTKANKEKRMEHEPTEKMYSKAELDAKYQEGIQAERDRCQAHIELAKGSGGFEIALESIEKGEGITHLVSAKHQRLAWSKNTKNQLLKADEELDDSTQVETQANDEKAFTKAFVDAALRGTDWTPRETPPHKIN